MILMTCIYIQHKVGIKRLPPAIVNFNLYYNGPVYMQIRSLPIEISVGFLMPEWPLDPLASCSICGKKCKSNHILYLYQFIHVKIGMWQSYFRDFIRDHSKIIHQKHKWIIRRPFIYYFFQNMPKYQILNLTRKQRRCFTIWNFGSWQFVLLLHVVSRWDDHFLLW